MANPAPTNWTPLAKPWQFHTAAKGLFEWSLDKTQITYQPNGKHQWQFQTRIRQRPNYPIDLKTIRLSRALPFVALVSYLRCGVTHKAMEGCGLETGWFC